MLTLLIYIAVIGSLLFVAGKLADRVGPWWAGRNERKWSKARQREIRHG